MNTNAAIESGRSALTKVRIFRHLESDYTEGKRLKAQSPTYQTFLAAYNANPFSSETYALAQQADRDFPRTGSDDETRLASGEIERGRKIGAALSLRYQAESHQKLIVFHHQILFLES